MQRMHNHADDSFRSNRGRSESARISYLVYGQCLVLVIGCLLSLVRMGQHQFGPREAVFSGCLNSQAVVALKQMYMSSSGLKLLKIR